MSGTEKARVNDSYCCGHGCLQPEVSVLYLQGTELNDDRTPSDATVTTTFNILVIDINDNAPEFNSSEYSVAITELAQVGFALPLFIQVVDKDEVSPWDTRPM